jgi:hypothetical protein
MVTHQLYCLTVGDRAGSQLGWKQRSSIRAADGKASSYLALQATMHMLGTPCKCMATWELRLMSCSATITDGQQFVLTCVAVIADTCT